MSQIIERVLEFSRHQITDVMSAYDPSYRTLHKTSESGALEGLHSDLPKLDFSVYQVTIYCLLSNASATMIACIDSFMYIFFVFV